MCIRDRVIVNIAASHTSMMVLNSDGLKASDLRPLVRFNIMIILKKGKEESEEVPVAEDASATKKYLMILLE